MTITGTWHKVDFIDMRQLWETIQDKSDSPSDRLRLLLQAAGVESHDPDGQYICEPKVFVRTIGGMLVSCLEFGGVKNCINVGVEMQPIGSALIGLRQAMGIAAMDSYLNTGDKSPNEMWDLNCDLHGTPSVAHTAQLGFFVAGLSAKAELELNCQRDIVHLSRLTSARTVTQDNPPILVEDPNQVEFYKGLRNLINEQYPITERMKKDDREVRNSAWPLAKCSILGITGSVKNLLKLAELSSDKGKEDEVRRICFTIGHQVRQLFPELKNG